MARSRCDSKQMVVEGHRFINGAIVHGFQYFNFVIYWRKTMLHWIAKPHVTKKQALDDARFVCVKNYGHPNIIDKKKIIEKYPESPN